jgi:hypothetical protein
MSRGREPGEKVARVRLGSYEFRKRGVSRFDLRDPYHLAITLTWPQFLAALFLLYLSVNIVFATLFWLVPGSVANARSNSFSDVFFFSIETLSTVGYGDMYPAAPYGRAAAGIEILCGIVAVRHDRLRCLRASSRLTLAIVEFKLAWASHLLSTMDYTYRECHGEAIYRFEGQP